MKDTDRLFAEANRREKQDLREVIARLKSVQADFNALTLPMSRNRKEAQRQRRNINRSIDRFIQYAWKENDL